jgi:hypothetical protein
MKKQKSVKSVSRYHWGSLHGNPQPPAALYNPQQPHWPLGAPRSIPQPPYGLLQLSGADAKKSWEKKRKKKKKKSWESNSRKKTIR